MHRKTGELQFHFFFFEPVHPTVTGISRIKPSPHFHLLIPPPFCCRSTKTHPGPVVHLSDSPKDEGKVGEPRSNLPASTNSNCTAQLLFFSIDKKVPSMHLLSVSLLSSASCIPHFCLWFLTWLPCGSCEGDSLPHDHLLSLVHLLLHLTVPWRLARIKKRK